MRLLQIINPETTRIFLKFKTFGEKFGLFEQKWI
jgi:hypothetical protein